jgi:diadenosine tetraphosphate (Ap4A) HIT family hydrolase
MKCPFCQPDDSIIAKTALSCAFFDNFPVSKGHALVIPKRHVATIWELSEDEYVDVFDLVKKVKDMIQKKFDPQGINVGVNCGQAAGQTVFHAHIHIIPRYAGDVPNPRGGCETSFPAKGIIKGGSLHQCPLPNRLGRAENKLIQICFVASFSKTRSSHTRKQADNFETKSVVAVLGVLLASGSQISPSSRYRSEQRPSRNGANS